MLGLAGARPQTRARKTRKHSVKSRPLSDHWERSLSIAVAVICGWNFPLFLFILCTSGVALSAVRGVGPGGGGVQLTIHPFPFSFSMASVILRVAISSRSFICGLDECEGMRNVRPY